MLISAQQVRHVLRVYAQQKAVKQAWEQKAVPSPGQVSLVAGNQELQELKRVVSQIPEVREERVEALKRAIKTGVYNRSGEEIAEKMICRSLVDSLF